MRDRSDLRAFVQYERRYDRPVETVWKALTEPERLADWMGAAKVEPYVGGRYELFIDEPEPMRGRVVTWQPPLLLEYRWRGAGAPDSVVRCELVPDGSGTRLIFMHRALRFAASCLSLGVFRMSDFKQPTNPRRQIANVGLVLLIHAGLFYAVAVGLGHSVVQVIRNATDVQLIPDEIKPPEERPLPMPPKLMPPPPATFVLPDIPVTTQSKSALQQVAPMTDAAPPAPPRVEEKTLPQPMRVAPVIDAARSCKLPQYPAVSIRLGEEGMTDLEFLIDTDGRVAESRIAGSSGHERLDEAARNAMSQCRFTPGTVDGKPERSWAHLHYRWTLTQ